MLNHYILEVKMRIKQEDNNKIIIGDKDKGFITSQSVEANLFYAILEKLEDMRWGIIDMESSINPR